MSVTRRMSRRARGTSTHSPMESASSTPGELKAKTSGYTDETIQGRIGIVLENLYQMGASKHPLGNVFRRTAREMLRDLDRFPETQVREKIREFAQVVSWVADAPIHVSDEIENGEQRELTA